MNIFKVIFISSSMAKLGHRTCLIVKNKSPTTLLNALCNIGKQFAVLESKLQSMEVGANFLGRFLYHD